VPSIWHREVFKYFKEEPLVLVIRQYAQRYYLKRIKRSLTETVKNYQEFLPSYLPMPHPSLRNQNWVMVNPWFMVEVIPELQKRIMLTLGNNHQTAVELNILNIRDENNSHICLNT
jgi:uracil-DNA glycosylase